MPFIEEKVGGFLPLNPTQPKQQEGSGLSTAAKIGTVGAIGVGLYGAPLLTLGGLAVGGAAALSADSEGAESAFRTENTIGSFMSSQSFGYDGKVDESYDPWEDIAGTEHEQYWDRFSRARNKEHADLIRADIERERRDREYLESQGMLGFAQSMAAGLFDLPSLLPGGAVVRSTRGGYSATKSALTVGAYGAGGAAITEGALQSTQQLRTPEESALNIAGATILSGVLGAGMASRMSRAELDIMGKRVEQEFGSPRMLGEDPASPQMTTSQPVDELEAALYSAASDMNLFRIHGLRIALEDNLAAPKAGDDQFALRGFHSPAIRTAENLNQQKGTGEQFWKQITKAPGVRKDELEWMGLEEFLAGKKSITKDEVLSFMRAHQVKLDERILSESGEGLETSIQDVEVSSVPIYDSVDASFVTDAEKAWLFQSGDQNYYIVQTDSQSFNVLEETGFFVGGATNFEAAQHLAVGKASPESAARFEGYKVPGGENYRELLIRLPELGEPQDAAARQSIEAAQARFDELVETDPMTGREIVDPANRGEVDRLRTQISEGILSGGETPRYTSPHFQDQEIVHLRVDDRTGPNGEKVLFINEVQSDLHQQGRKKGYSDQAPWAVLKDDGEVEEFSTQAAANAFVSESPGATHLGRQKKPDAVPDAPFKGDLWLELALKRALLYASENGYDAVSWARSDQIAKAVGGDAEALSVQYDQKIGRFLSKYTKKWGGKVEEARVVDEKLDIFSITSDQIKILAETLESNGRLDAAKQVRGRGIHVITEDTYRIATETARELGIFSNSNPILSITPAMRSSVMEGQPLGIRRDQSGTVAEGKFNREELLITISRMALDPIGTLRHEAVHALRAINLFTSREWKALTNAAKSKGWMDVPEIRDYQKIYGKPLEDENIVEEAIAMAFQRHVSGEQVQRGILGSVFQRMKNFLERIAGVLKGQGMNTADDVFRRISEGDIAARADPTGARQAMPAAGMTSAGAASAQQGDLRLKSALGAEKAFAFLSPAMRLQNSPARESRRWVAELAETALTYNDHKDWVVTARGGAEMGEPGSVETRVKLHDTNIAAGFRALDNTFMEYRKGNDKRRTGDLTVASLRDATAGPPQGKMDYRQFREAVSSALRRGDEHEIPQVAKAAKILRNEVFEPLLQRAIALGMLPEDVTPQTAASYLNRMYNKERIIAERPQFKQVVAKWLQENEIHNQVVRGRLAQHVDELEGIEKKIKLATERMKARAKRDLDASREGKQIDPEKSAAKDEADQAVLAEQSTRQNELRQLIEEQVQQYQGDTAKAAKAALEARRKVEETRDPDAARLRAADKDVMKAAKKIAEQTGKEDAELDTLADEIIDRILGTPEGRLPYDAHMSQKSQFGGVNMEARGPLAARQFMIPDERIEPWLENDVDILMRAYVHTMAADTELTARFGSPDMVMQFKQINEEYARLAANTDPKGRKRLHEQKKRDFLDLGAIRDRIRGTYALPADPDAIHVRVLRNMMTLNYMRLLGGMTISAIPDLHRFIATNGVLRTFGDGIVPMFRNVKGYRKSGDESKWLSGALEMVTDNRAMRIADITDTFGRHTKFERGVQAAGRNFGIVSMMAPWNAVMKQVAGTVTQTRVLRGAEKLFNGKPLKQKDIEYFADLGISEGALRQIGEQFKKHGHKENGVWFANTAEWDEGMRPAIDALRVGLRKEVDRIIVTPSFGERPRFASTLTGAMLLQFKSFAISATQKMLVSGLQARDLNQVNGAALAIALGGLVHILKGAVSGRDVEVDWDDEASVKQFMGNAFDRSGLAGVLMEFNNIAEKVTDGRVGLSALTGKPISRYASRNVTASLLGPGFGLAEDSFQALNSALGNRDWKARDTHNARQLLPYSNLFYLRSAFDQAEIGINEAFGVPAK